MKLATASRATLVTAAFAALAMTIGGTTVAAQNSTHGPDPVGTRSNCTFARGVSECDVTQTFVTSQNRLIGSWEEIEAVGAPIVVTHVGDVDTSRIVTHPQGCPAGQGGVGDRFKGFGVRTTTVTTSQLYQRWLVQEWETVTTTRTVVSRVRHQGAPGSDGRILSQQVVSDTTSSETSAPWQTRQENGTYVEESVDSFDEQFGQNGFTSECFLSVEAYLAAFGLTN